jgi:hypothetical protein
MTPVDSIYVGRFDQKFAVQQLFPSLPKQPKSQLANTDDPQTGGDHTASAARREPSGR